MGRNLDGCKAVGTHWVAISAKNHLAAYLDSFKVKYIPKEIKWFIGNQNITTNIYIIPANDSIMCGYFWIEFIDFILK